MVEPTPGACLLCGEPATVAAVFVPGPRSFETPEGKTRLVGYSLCDACLGGGPVPDAGQLERIEKVIRFQLAQGAGRMPPLP